MADEMTIKILIVPERELEAIKARLDRLEGRGLPPWLTIAPEYKERLRKGRWCNCNAVSPTPHEASCGIYAPQTPVWCDSIYDSIRCRLAMSHRGSHQYCADTHYNAHGEHAGVCNIWIRLSDLRPGAVFETQDGIRGTKACYQVWAVDGTHAIGGISHKDGTSLGLSQQTLVREIALP